MDTEHKTHGGIFAYFVLWLTNLEAFFEERDKRYEERFSSIETGNAKDFAAAKEKVADAFAASEKAITKAEVSQKEYNANHNDLARKMEKQYSEMLPRSEANFMMKDIDDLKLFMSKFSGIAETKRENKDMSKWVVGLVISVFLLLITIIGFLIKFKGG